MPEETRRPFSLDEERPLTPLESSLKAEETPDGVEVPPEVYEGLEANLVAENIQKDGFITLTPKAIKLEKLPFTRVQKVRAVI